MTPASSSTPAAETPPGEQSLQAEQVRLLFRFSLVGYLATLMVVLILGALLWQEMSRPALFAWFFAISLVTVGRYLIYKAFIQLSPPDEATASWERRFLAGSLMAAICWAAIGTVLLPASDAGVQRFSVVFLVMLLMIGAVAYYAPHRYAYKVTAFIGLVPMALVLGGSGDRRQVVLSGAILFLAVILPYVHERVYRALVESLSTRRSREQLLQALE